MRCRRSALRIREPFTDHLLVEPEVDDLLVIPATVAYTFTFSNNHNGALGTPVVLREDGRAPRE